MAATAGGTAVVEQGLVRLALATLVLQVAGTACLLLLPRLPETWQHLPVKVRRLSSDGRFRAETGEARTAPNATARANAIRMASSKGRTGMVHHRCEGHAADCR